MRIVPTTLLLIIKDNKILLAKKARGFAAGKFNGVGGKQEPGENIFETMIRETQEEISVTPKDYSLVGIIEFFEYHKDEEEKDIMHIFIAKDYDGIPTKSDEMDPMWFDLDKVPFENMFPDDRYWLPRILAGEKLLGLFRFDKDFNLLAHKLKSVSQEELNENIEKTVILNDEI